MIPSVKTLKEDPLYKHIKGRSKMSHEEIYQHILALRKQQKERMKTTILPDAPMQGHLVSFLDTKQKGRYSRISRQAHCLTRPLLYRDKLDRMLISIYDWFHQRLVYSEPDTLTLKFQDSSSVFTCYLTKSKLYCKIEWSYVDTTDHWRSTSIRNNIELAKTNENLYIILKTFELIYNHYRGNLHHSSSKLVLKPNLLNAQDLKHIQAIHSAQGIKIPFIKFDD